MQEVVYQKRLKNLGIEFKTTCEICGKSQGDNWKSRRLAVDHDHNCCPKGEVCKECARGYFAMTAMLG